MANLTGMEPQPVVVLSEQQLAALITLVIASLGSYCHFFLLTAILRGATQNSPFFLLIASQSLSEGMLLFHFASYYVAMLYYDFTLLKRWSRVVGAALIALLDVVNASHLVIALNRLVAISAPTKYPQIFSRRSTHVYIAVIWISSIPQHIYFEYYIDCYFRYVDDAWGYMFMSDPKCSMVYWLTDFAKQMLMVALIAVTDFVTLVMVKITSSKLTRGEPKQAIAKRKAELNFLKQALCQFSFWIAEMSCYFFINYWFEALFMKWSTTTLAWILMHTGDGFLTVGSNKEIRRLFLNPGKVFLCWSRKKGWKVTPQITMVSRVTHKAAPSKASTTPLE